MVGEGFLIPIGQYRCQGSLEFKRHTKAFDLGIVHSLLNSHNYIHTSHSVIFFFCTCSDLSQNEHPWMPRCNKHWVGGLSKRSRLGKTVTKPADLNSLKHRTWI